MTDKVEQIIKILRKHDCYPADSDCDCIDCTRERLELAKEIVDALYTEKAGGKPTCSRCEGSGLIYADGKAHSHFGGAAPIPCPECQNDIDPTKYWWCHQCKETKGLHARTPEGNCPKCGQWLVANHLFDSQILPPVVSAPDLMAKILSILKLHTPHKKWSISNAECAKQILAKVQPLLTALQASNDFLMKQNKQFHDELVSLKDKPDPLIASQAEKIRELTATIEVACELLETELGGFVAVEAPYYPERLANIKNAYEQLKKQVEGK